MEIGQYIIVLLVIILTGGLFYYVSKQKEIGGLKIIEDSLKTDDLRLYTKHLNLIKDTIKNFYLDVSVYEVLAVIKNESSYRSLIESNENIIGDKNLNLKAYGIMQVRKPAMIDVNSNFKTVYKEDDLKQLHVNIIVGSCYLDLCKTQARKEVFSKQDQQRLMFKKYNAGIGTKINIKNSSDKYSYNAIDNYNIFLNIG